MRFRFSRFAFPALLACAVLFSCTPSVVPVSVPASTPEQRTASPFRVSFLGLEKALLTRGAIGEGALGTRWPIDARSAISDSIEQSLRAGEATTAASLVTVRLADFDVDWTSRANAGVAELTLRSLVQIECTYETSEGTTTSTFVGRGRRVDTSWGPKIDQRLGENISAVVDEAARSVASQLVAELQRRAS